MIEWRIRIVGQNPLESILRFGLGVQVTVRFSPPARNSPILESEEEGHSRNECSNEGNFDFTVRAAFHFLFCFFWILFLVWGSAVLTAGRSATQEKRLRTGRVCSIFTVLSTLVTCPVVSLLWLIQCGPLRPSNVLLHP